MEYRVYVTYENPETKLTGVPATVARFVEADSESEAKHSAESAVKAEYPDAIILSAEVSS